MFVVLMCDVVAQLGTGFAVSHWAPRAPDAVHSYPIRWRGGTVTFVQPWLGKYFEYGFWAVFVLMAMLFLVQWWCRDQVEKIG
jgi:hypothetical protein